MKNMFILRLFLLVSVISISKINFATDTTLDESSVALQVRDNDLSENLLENQDPVDQENPKPIGCFTKFKDSVSGCCSRTGACLKRNKQTIALPVVASLTTLLDYLTNQQTGRSYDVTVQQEFGNRVTALFEKITGLRGYKARFLVKALLLWAIGTGITTIDDLYIAPNLGFKLSWGPGFGLAAFYTIIKEFSEDDKEKFSQLYKKVEAQEAKIQALEGQAQASKARRRKKKSKAQPALAEEAKRESSREEAKRAAPDKGDGKVAVA